MVRVRKILEENSLIEKMHRPEKKVILLMAKWSPIAVTMKKLLAFHCKKFPDCKFYYVDIDEFEQPKRFFDYTTVPILKCIDKDGDLLNQKATSSNKKILKLLTDLNDNGFDKARGKIDLRRFSKDPKQLEEFIRNRKANPIEIIEEDYEAFEESEEELEVRQSAPRPEMKFEDVYSSDQRRRNRRRERNLQNKYMAQLDEQTEEEEDEQEEEKEESPDFDIEQSRNRFDDERRMTLEKVKRNARPSRGRRFKPAPTQSDVSLDLDSIIRSREKRRKRLEKERKREDKLDKMLKLDQKKRRKKPKPSNEEQDDDEDDIIMDSDSESEREERDVRTKNGRWKRREEDPQDLLELGYEQYEEISSTIKKNSKIKKKKETKIEKRYEIADDPQERSTSRRRRRSGSGSRRSSSGGRRTASRPRRSNSRRQRSDSKKRGSDFDEGIRRRSRSSYRNRNESSGRKRAIDESEEERREREIEPDSGIRRLKKRRQLLNS